MDLLQGVQEGAAEAEKMRRDVPDPTDPDTLRELLEFFNKSSEFSDEEKEEMRKNLLNRAHQFGTQAAGGYSSMQIIVFLVVVCFIAGVFTFIGYKIYKPMADRERRLAEKKMKKELKMESKKKRR